MDISPIVFYGSIFVLAIFVGYYVVWSVTPALHTPLMSVTNAISAVIIVGAIIAIGTEIFWITKYGFENSFFLCINFCFNKYIWWLPSNQENVSYV